MSLRIRLVLGLLLLSSNLDLNSSQTIIGNAGSTTQTTNFPISTHAFDIFGGPLEMPTMYIGAGNTSAQQYAISRANPVFNQLQPLAPAILNFNNQAGQANPLFGAKIDFLKLNGDKPVAIINGSQTVYKYTSIMDAPYLVSSNQPVLDAAGLSPQAILNLEVANGGLAQTFVACTPNGSANFGDTGSGIALFEYRAGNTQTPAVYMLQNNNQACALDNSTPAISLNSDHVTLANMVDMCWSGELNCLYVALQATAGGSAGDGARSIVVGKINPVPGQNYDTITFQPFVPANAITGNNQIIGTATLNSTVSALKIKTMRTSTRINYLVIVGGNGAANTVGNQVYAVPLVSGGNIANIGQLASINQVPTDTFVSNLNLFASRSLNTPAATSSDLLTNTDAAAQVGGGPLPINPSDTISDLFTSGDSVYVSIGTTSGSTTGIFYSQAIIDGNGLIANWTPWQRAGGSTVPMFGAAVNAINGSFWYLTGASASNVNTISFTQWSNGYQDGLLGGTTSNAGLGLVSNLSNLFPSYNGGLFNLVNVPSNDPGLNNMTLLLATGSEQVALINPSAAIAGNFSSGLVTSNNDHYPSTTTNSTIVDITGNNLTTLGPITTIHLATNASNKSWLFVGGANGVAVLQNAGSGWNAPISSLAGITSAFNFTLLGNYQFVQKIASDNDYLYILTQDKLDRIALISTNFTGTPSITTIATFQDLVGATSADTFYDLVVSGSLGLLGTSAGLFRVSNGSSIQNPTVVWSTVVVPEQITVPCTKLIVISPNGLDSGLINGGNLYIVNSYRGLQQTTINRFYVSNNGGNISINPLPDLYVKNILSYFINFETFKDLFFTNGTLLINSLSKDTIQTTYAYIMQPGIASGARIPEVKRYYNINLNDITQANFISNILCSSASGALLISGEFDIRVNE